MFPGDLCVALWLLSHSALSVPYSGYVCSNASTAPLCSAQISSRSLPLFGSLYDGDYHLPPTQGFPDWFFSYKDRMKQDAAPPASCRESSRPTMDDVRPSIFTFSTDSPSTQTNRSEVCHDKAF